MYNQPGYLEKMEFMIELFYKCKETGENAFPAQKCYFCLNQKEYKIQDMAEILHTQIQW